METATIHIDPSSGLADLTPIQRYLTLTLLVAIRDGATSLCQTSEIERSRLTLLVDGREVEVEPFPELLAPQVGRDVRKWIQPSRFRRRMADLLRRLANRFDQDHFPALHYQVLLVVDPCWALWGVTIETGPRRDRVVFDLLESTSWAREQAGRILETWKSTGKDRLPTP